jgi:hypothetical protein
MAQVVSRRPLAAEVRVRARPVYVGFVADKVALGWDFLRVLRVSHVRIIPRSISIIIYHFWHEK